MDTVKIFDTTLRDGEQSPGISLDVAEKLEIAEQLARLGVDVIEAGFPIASDGDFESVEAIAKAVRGPIIAGLSRTGFKDVDRAWEAVRHAERPRIHVFIATSKIHMEKKLRMTPEQVKAEVAASVARAKGYLDDVEYSPEDGYRSDPEFMCEVCQIAVDNGATTLNIPDTVGFAVPEDYGKLIKYVIDNVQRRLRRLDALPRRPRPGGRELAGRRRQRRAAGRVRDQRPGRARRQRRARRGRDGDQDAPRLLRGRRRRTCKSDELARTSRLVSRLTGYHVQFNKAVVGRNAFAHEAGIHQHGVLADRETYEMIDASTGRPGSRADRAGQALGPARVRRHAREDGHPRAGRRAQRRVRALQGARRQEGRDHRGRPRGDRRRGARHRHGAPLQRARARAARRHRDASRPRASCSATATARSRRPAAATA